MNYYRRGGFLSTIPQVTKVLLIINVVVFIIDMLITSMYGHVVIRSQETGITYLNYFGGLWSFNTGLFKPYQFVSHMFLHGNFSHLFFNMFGVYMFGRYVESSLESKKYFILYFVAGLFAAILQLSIYIIQGTGGVMVGASGALFGLLVAFAMLFPEVELMLIFLPIPIKAKYFALIYAIAELFFGVANFNGDNIAHFAHIGGAIVGYIFIKIWKRNQFKVY